VFEAELGILVAAVLIDLIVGEPPENVHPVVWIGKMIDHLDGQIVRVGGDLDLIKGAGVLTASILLSGILTFLVMEIVATSAILEVLVGGFILKSTFSFNYFKGAIRAVHAGLRSGDIEAARTAVSMLVSRNPDKLDEAHITSATVETASENLVDGILAPLLFFSVFGVVGAVIYRVVNTADSMLGYRNERYRDVGFASAKLDDLLNLIPARVGGVMIALACGGGFDVMIRDRRKCNSPNSGYPMGAIAGGLGIWLEKMGDYRINDGGRAPEIRDIEKCLDVMDIVFILAILLAVVLVVGG
jgi:adenosylcobinamide-phosphate synthase